MRSRREISRLYGRLEVCSHLTQTEVSEGITPGSLDLDGALELILKLLDASPYTTNIIDALDECFKDGRGCVLECIKMALVKSGF